MSDTDTDYSLSLADDEMSASDTEGANVVAVMFDTPNIGDADVDPETINEPAIEEADNLAGVMDASDIEDSDVDSESEGEDSDDPFPLHAKLLSDDIIVAKVNKKFRHLSWPGLEHVPKCSSKDPRIQDLATFFQAPITDGDPENFVTWNTIRDHVKDNAAKLQRALDALSDQPTRQNQTEIKNLSNWLHRLGELSKDLKNDLSDCRHRRPCAEWVSIARDVSQMWDPKKTTKDQEQPICIARILLAALDVMILSAYSFDKDIQSRILKSTERTSTDHNSSDTAEISDSQTIEEPMKFTKAMTEKYTEIDQLKSEELKLPPAFTKLDIPLSRMIKGEESRCLEKMMTYRNQKRQSASGLISDVAEPDDSESDDSETDG